MSLRAALDSIARRIGFVANAPQPCATCGPKATPGRTTVIRALGGLVETCPDCSRRLDHVGHPIGVPTPRGTYTLEISTDDVRQPEIP